MRPWTKEERAEVKAWKKRLKKARPKKRSAGWHVEQHCRGFWHQFEKLKSNEERIVILISMTTKVYRDFSAKVRQAKRKRFDENKNKYFKLYGECGVCGYPANVRHHIIPLMNGGLNHGINLIRLCNYCHGRIHPWLNNYS